MVRLSNAGFDCMKDMITYLRRCAAILRLCICLLNQAASLPMRHAPHAVCISQLLVRVTCSS